MGNSNKMYICSKDAGHVFEKVPVSSVCPLCPSQSFNFVINPNVNSQLGLEKDEAGIIKLYVCTTNDVHLLEIRPHNNICPFCQDKSFVFMYEISDTHSRWEGVIERYKNL